MQSDLKKSTSQYLGSFWRKLDGIVPYFIGRLESVGFNLEDLDSGFVQKAFSSQGFSGHLA